MWIKLIKISAYGLAIKQIADQVASVREERQSVRRRYRNTNLAIGMTVGAALGTTAALMLTPRTGRQARQALARQANETMGHIRQRASRVKEHAHEAWDERKEVRQARRAGC